MVKCGERAAAEGGLRELHASASDARFFAGNSPRGKGAV